MNKIINYIISLINSKFSGEIIITFSQGGIRACKKVKYENVDLK